MIGGLVNDVIFEGDRVLLEVLDRRDRMWRSVPLSPRSRCVGAGDAIWWHGNRTLWTPAASERSTPGRDCDVELGKSWAIAAPEFPLSARRIRR